VFLALPDDPLLNRRRRLCRVSNRKQDAFRNSVRYACSRVPFASAGSRSHSEAWRGSCGRYPRDSPEKSFLLVRPHSRFPADILRAPGDLWTVADQTQPSLRGSLPLRNLPNSRDCHDARSIGCDHAALLDFLASMSLAAVPARTGDARVSSWPRSSGGSTLAPSGK
jgi:hypothetical protein